MTSLKFDILLFLALLFSIPSMIPAKSSGPEGPVGAFIIPIPACILIGVLLGVLVGNGRFDWVPGGKALAFVLLPGVLVGLGSVMMLSFAKPNTVGSFLAGVSPIPVLLCCVWAIHRFESVIPPAAGRIGSATILGAAAAGGWGLMLWGGASWVRGQVRESEIAIERERIEEQQRAAEDLAKFRALPDTPLSKLLDYAFSVNQQVKAECRSRIAARPNFDDELIEALGAEWNHTAVAYVAYVAESPSARLAPAYARVMDQQLEGWRSTIEHDPNVGKSEPELRTLIEGAGRIQAAGGDLRPQLQAWQESVSKSKVLGGLDLQIRSTLQRAR